MESVRIDEDTRCELSFIGSRLENIDKKLELLIRVLVALVNSNKSIEEQITLDDL